jgi:serine protease Do
MIHGFERVSARLRQSLVQVLPGSGGGAGVIWDADGCADNPCVATNAHVVPGDNATIVDAAGRRSLASVILRDRERDLALLQPDPPALGPLAEIADSDSVRPGQLVLALGNPMGLTGAVAAGVIHTVGPIARQNWIQADVRLAPGNSGGMLADASGRVIGITTMVLNGLALAIPSNEINAFVRCVHLKKTA